MFRLIAFARIIIGWRSTADVRHFVLILFWYVSCLE